MQFTTPLKHNKLSCYSSYQFMENLLNETNSSVYNKCRNPPNLFYNFQINKKQVGTSNYTGFIFSLI